MAKDRGRAQRALRRIARSGEDANELRVLAASRPARWTLLVISALVLLAPVADLEYLPAHASAHAALNAFSVNNSALLGLILGILGTTGAELRRSVGNANGPFVLRAVLGAKARAYGLVAFLAAPVFCLMAAAVALPLLGARGIPAPAFHDVSAYVEREAVAAARLAIVGVAIGIVAKRRIAAAATLVGFLILEDIAAAHIYFIKNYGPIGALNAFSDPTHSHQLSVAAGGAIALAWALAALIAADRLLEFRLRRDSQRTRSADAAEPK